ncbi:MAG: hypothetical protein JW751_20275 [Polyangiaceae bacterium]|nr:hypothetical protein [Polyangiaceae bacterium]
MSPGVFRVFVFLLAGLGCDRHAPLTTSGTARPSPSSLSSAPPPARALTEAEAIARVRALPEFKALSSEVVAEDTESRHKIPHARVMSAPRFESTSAGDDSWWGIVVADQARFDAHGGLTGGEPPDLDLRVDGLTGAISVRDQDLHRFRGYVEWAAAQQGWHRSAALVFSIPEWDAEAAVTRNSPAGRTKGAVLSLAYGQEPTVDCQPGAPDCRYTFTAISICSGCAGGRWVDFEVDLAKQAVFVGDGDFASPVPYGKWRHHSRAQARRQGFEEYRPLLDWHHAFPEHRPGDGPLGYGRASPAGRPPVSPALRTALERGGYLPVRTERYASGFRVYVVRPIQAGAPQTRDLRTWGADLVRANGGRACEVVVEGSNERFQFDGFALQGKSGGVYVLVDDDFHPWLKPE